MDMAEAIDFVQAKQQVHRSGCLCPKCKGQKVDGKITTRKLKISEPSSKKRFNDKVKELHEKQVINLDPKKKKTVEARKFSGKERSKLADKGVAEPNGSYPIANKKDLANARKDIARSSDPTSVDRAHIVQRAKSLGVTAGGAGSGRHKEASDGPRARTSDAQRGLNIMHQGMKSAGFKWKSSSPSETFKGAAFHEYKNSKNQTSAGIREHSDGKLEFTEK